MNSAVYSVLISSWFLFFQWCSAITEESLLVPKGFVAYRAVSALQKSCTCPTLYSCSCCQTVTIFYTKAEKNLCTNFIYRRNGLKIDVTLNSNIIKSKLVTEYKPLKFCSNIPGCPFSSACVNVLELNQFPRSITACLRLDIFTKKRLWQLSYDCVSISTELPMMPSSNSTMQMTNGTGGTSAMSTTMKPTTASNMSTSQMTMTTTMMTTMTTAMTTTTTTMKTTTEMKIEVEKEETTPDVEIITIPGNMSTTIMDID